MKSQAAKTAVQQTLVETAAQILSDEGPAALSARRLAAESGTSTMAIYTHFGSMKDVVRDVVREGFRRLSDRLATVDTTEDPVRDLAEMGRAYRTSAHTSPHLYAVMVGGSTIAGFQLSEQDRRIGAYTMRPPIHTIRRCIHAGRFRSTDPKLVAYQYWCAIHGHVTLEFGGYFLEREWHERSFNALLRDFAVGAGDTLDAATKSTAPN